MSATISAALASKLTVVETFTGSYISSADNTITANGMNEEATYNASSTPAATKHTSFQQALSSGSATLDLTALPGLTGDETVNGNGLKVQILKFRNLAANANKITIAKGASNGYQLDGATTWSVVLAPGQSALFFLNGAADIIGSTKKTIDLSGTSAQILEVQVVIG